MTNHPSTEELFAYRDGELEKEARGLIEAHVLSCTACAARLEAWSDAEGALRQIGADPSDEYLGTLSASVMERVRGGVAAAGAAGATAAQRTSPGARNAGVKPQPAARRGRSRNFDEGGRAPGLPWPAILSSASAAAAVVVVVIMLIQRPDAWRSAPAPQVTGLPGEKAKSEVDADGADGAEKEDQAATPAPPEPSTWGATSPTTDAPVADRLAIGNSAPEPLRKSSESAADKVDLPAPAGSRDAVPGNEVETKRADEAMPEVAAQRQALEENARLRLSRTGAVAGAARGEAPAAAAAPSVESAFPELAARYGLPLLYDPGRVPGSALLRAEPELRLLYQTGRAGDDSARVRIYLAEAARERGAGSYDTETFDAIVHHYRRAAVLARDVATAQLARKRLEDFVTRSAPDR
jgi:hypothetical protein